MKKIVAMAGFHFLVSKIWKKIVFYVVIRREIKVWFVFLKRKKLTLYFMQICNEIFIDIFLKELEQ